jgi:hypothetical protein
MRDARAFRTSRRQLIDAVKLHLLPRLLASGFHLAPLAKSGEDLDRELVASLPLGRLRRRRDDGAGFDLVEIDFDRRRPAFRLTAGVAPAGGVATFAGSSAPEDALVGWLDQFFEMYANPTWRRWFGIWRWPWQTVPTRIDYEQLVKSVCTLLPEVEAALQNGRLGPHMRLVVLGSRVPKR